MEGITVNEAHLDTDSMSIALEVWIGDPQLYNLLSSMEEDERADFVCRALKIGAIALQGSETRMQVDFVRKEFELMRKEMEAELEKIFSDRGSLHTDLDRFLGEDGKLKNQLDAHFGKDGGEIYRVLNPDDETTPIGRFRERLQEELELDREGTAFNRLMKLMDEGFTKVLVELGAAEAVEEEREKGTAKGLDLESHVYECLDALARSHNDAVEHVGREKGPLGKVGDVLIRVNPRDTGNIERSIVVEVKNRKPTMSGKNSFFKELEDAKENRGAQYAIGAVHEDKIPDSCGCFRIYPGNNIVCSVSQEEDPLTLEIAYNVARAELVCSALREDVSLDTSSLKAKIKDVEGQLQTLRAVKSALTRATDRISGAKEDLKKMEDKIRETLSEILGMIRRGKEQ